VYKKLHETKIYGLQITNAQVKSNIIMIVVIHVATGSRHQCCNHCLPYQYYYDQSNGKCHLKMGHFVPKHAELNKFTHTKGKMLKMLK
jgi:hypothetical protein